MTSYPTFEFSVTCAGCGATYKGVHEHPLQLCDAGKAAGWDIPDILENRAIKCPTCKPK